MLAARRDRTSQACFFPYYAARTPRSQWDLKIPMQGRYRRLRSAKAVAPARLMTLSPLPTIKYFLSIEYQRRRWEFGYMGPYFRPRKIEYSSPGKAETIRDSDRGSVEQLIAENERLQLLLVELLIKNEHLRTRIQALNSYWLY
jgi:hypothetical protein